MSVFRFKQFDVKQANNPLKVGTDSMLLGAFINVIDKKHGLDLGTGTGVLSLMVAQKNTEILLDAIEINKVAAEECAFNFQNSPWKNRLDTIEGDYLKFQFDKSYDLIFSNPPYHLEEVYGRDKAETLAKHSDSKDLTKLIQLASKLLTFDGDFWLILPFQLLNYIQEITLKNQLFCKELIRIHAKESKPNTRIILCFTKRKTDLLQCDFYIRKENNSYSQAYIELTKKFHFIDLS